MENPSTIASLTNEPFLIPVKEDPQHTDSPKQTSLLKGNIILNPGISITNFVTFLLFSAFNGIFTIPFALLAMPLLTVVYGLSPTQREDLGSMSQLVQLGLKFLIAPVIGYICDKYGRKPIIILAVTSTLIAAVTLPNLPTSPSVYPWYILNSLFLEIGIACIMTAPLLADYIDDRTKGRVAGLATVMLYISSFTITYLNENMDLKHNLPLKYYELACVGGLMLILAAIGIKGGAYHKKQFKLTTLRIENRILSQGPTQASEEDALRTSIEGLLRIEGSTGSQVDVRRSFQGGAESTALQVPIHEEKLSLTVGFKQMRNPWILIGFLCYFLGIACAVLLNSILTNYISAITGDNTTNQAIVLTNKHLLSAIFSSLFCGFFADKVNKFLMIIIVTLISILSVILLLIAPSPFHPMAYASMVCFGIVTGGYMTLGAQILGKYPNPKFRASVLAVAGMFAMFGNSSIGVLGLYLMQFDVAIPFYLYLGFAGAGLGILTVIYILKRNVLSKL